MFYIWAFSLLFLRIFFLSQTNLPLDCEEAQYWFWSQTLQFGYFSKPPMTSWLMGISTWIGGETAFWVRFFAPILHTLTSWVLYIWARQMLSRERACLVGLIYLTLPGTFFSSVLMTTDVPLLFFSAGTLLFFWKTLERKTGTLDALYSGAFFGLALLSKYIAIYLGISIGLFLLLVRPPQMTWAKGGIILGSALLVMSPNLYWQYINGFPTFHHTAQANMVIHDYGMHFHVRKALDYILGQIALLGPLIFIAFFRPCLWFWKKQGMTQKQTRQTLFFHVLIWPIFGSMIVQALLAKVNVNWGILMVLGVLPLIAEKLRFSSLKKILWVNLGLGLLGMIALLDYQMTSKLFNIHYKGHKPHALLASLETYAQKHPQTKPLHLITGSRCVAALGTFYAKNFTTVHKWFRGPVPHDHFDGLSPYQKDTPIPGFFLIARGLPREVISPYFETLYESENAEEGVGFLAQNFNP